MLRPMFRTAIFGFGLAVSGAALAADAPPPRWDISKTCAADALKGACPRVESDTRRTLLDRWTALPLDIRLTCSKATEADADRSYRKLAACIDDLAFKAFDQQRPETGPAPSQATSH